MLRKIGQRIHVGTELRLRWKHSCTLSKQTTNLHFDDLRSVTRQQIAELVVEIYARLRMRTKARPVDPYIKGEGCAHSC